MRQVVIQGAEQIALDEVPMPEPGLDDALVRSLRVGICGSDLHAYHGRHPFISLPVVPGHEVVGVVERIGANVGDLQAGDRVILEPNIVCGYCEHCRSGRYNLCDNLTVVGCVGPLDGGMADYFIAPATRLIKADPRLDDAQAAMVEPLATGTHAVRVAGGTADKRVAILGLGSIGLLTMQAAREGRARSIVGTDFSTAKRRRALEFGCDAVYHPADTDVVTRMRERLGGRADIIFDCVAVQSTVDQAIELAHKGGTVIIEGVPEQDVTIPLSIVQDREIRIQGTAMYTREDMLSAMQLLSTGKVDAGSLITRVFPLKSAPDAFAAAESGEEVKVHLTL